MNSCIASTLTGHTLGTHSSARPFPTPEQRLFLPHPRAAWVPTTAGHPLLPFPLQLMAQDRNFQQGGNKWGMPFCIADYFAQSFMRGHQPRTFTLRATSMATAALFYP